MNEICLSDLKKGDCCTLQSVALYSGQRRRLQDLGMMPGCEIVCAYIAPSGSPMAFWVKGALIALRRTDCRKIWGRRCE